MFARLRRTGGRSAFTRRPCGRRPRHRSRRHDLAVTTHEAMSGHDIEPETVRDYLYLSRLLNEVERDHPEVSASLRLTLVRSRRLNRAGWLDSERFRDVLIELTAGAASARTDDRIRQRVEYGAQNRRHFTRSETV